MKGNLPAGFRGRLSRLFLHDLFEHIPALQQVEGALELGVVVDRFITRGTGRRNLLFLVELFL